MKKHRKNGFSLIELIVALPMLAFVFLGMAYMLAVTGNFTAIEIAKVKTQTAANNVLMLMKAEGYSNIGDVLGVGSTIEVDGSGFHKKIDGEEIRKDSIVHPDGTTNLKLYLEEKTPDAGSNISSGNKICVIRVIAPDFENIETEIKAISF